MTERCTKSTVPVTPPGSTTPIFVPIEDVVNESITGVWTEVSRTTSTIDVQGVQIERIESVTFELPNESTVTLQFNNPGT